jgi:hypothetical protein
MACEYFAQDAESAYNELDGAYVMQPLFTSGPRSIGDIVGDAIRLCRSNIPFLLRRLLIPSLVELAGKVLLVAGLNIIAANKGDIVAVIAAAIACFIGMIVATIAEFFLTLCQLSIFRFFAGFATTYEEAYRFVWAKKFEVLGVVLLTYTAMTAAVLFWCIELGISIALLSMKALVVVGFIALIWGLVGLCLTLIWAILPFSLVAPALAIEQRPFTTVISKNLSLAFSSLLRATGFIIFIGLVLGLLSSVFNLPPAILMGIDMIHNWVELRAFNKPLNIYIQLFANIWRTAANMLLSPIAFMSCGFFYLDLRSRAQGLDIDRRLESLKEPAAKEF